MSRLRRLLAFAAALCLSAPPPAAVSGPGARSDASTTVGAIPSSAISVINFENTSIPSGSKFVLDLYNKLLQIKDEQGSPVTRVELGRIGGGAGDWGLRLRGAAGNPIANLWGADLLFQNDAASPTQGILIAGTLPGTWTRYFNLTGSGTMVYHDKMELRYDGTAIFRGVAQETDTSPKFSLDFPNRIFKIYDSAGTMSWEIYGASDRVMQDYRISGTLYWRLGVVAGTARKFQLLAPDAGAVNKIITTADQLRLGGAEIYSGLGTPLFVLEGNDPKIVWSEIDQTASNRAWDAVAAAGVLQFRAVADDDASQAAWMKVVRGSGVAISRVEFPSEVRFLGAVKRDDGSTNLADVAAIVVSTSAPSGDYPEATLWAKV